LSLPLYHVGGLGIVFRCLLLGATIVIGKSGQDIAESVRQYGITHLSLVPSQLQSLLDNLPQREALTSIKNVLVGGGFVPARLVEKAVLEGMPIHTTYGSTELASQVTTTGTDESADKLCTSGKILKYRELKLSNDREIMVRGKTLFKGYVTSSGVQSPFDSDGWFATGDLGELDAEGYLTVTGRKDNMFTSGGENIYPEEIESAMKLIGGVDDVIVVPIDDTRYGQRPVAFVKMKTGSEMSPEKLAIKLLDCLPKFKIPAEILAWPDDAPQFGIKPDRTYFEKLVKGSRD
jgi:O-succinylbenzoic acid--CoA ligase